MELTVDQALQRGVAAHKEGRLQNAERFYRAVLQIQPKHPDANHNLGVLAVSVGKIEEALPLLKQALDLNPEKEQFWLSYLDGLIRAGKADAATRVVADGKHLGVAKDKLSALSERIRQIPPQRAQTDTETFVAPETNETMLTTESRKNRVMRDDVLGTEPSQDQVQSVMKQYQEGRLPEAKMLAAWLVEKYPNHQFGWKMLGAVLVRMERFHESLDFQKKSVELVPHDADAHNNLGVTLQKLGSLDAAELCYRQAIAFKPSYAEAYYNLANTLQEQGRFKDAEACYRQALELRPDYPEAHSNLGITLKAIGKLGEAIRHYAEAIILSPDFAAAKLNLGSALTIAIFDHSEPRLYPPIIDLLTTGSFVRSREVGRGITSLLRRDSLIETLLAENNPPSDLKAVMTAIYTLDKLPLLHEMMRICSLPDTALETIFVSIRRVLLKERNTLEASPQVVTFLSTLALHCFTNEFVYPESEEEEKQVDNLGDKISTKVMLNKQPSLLEVLCFAAYRPLHHNDWVTQLAVLDQCEDIKRRLVEEPLIEREISRDIPSLGKISDNVSTIVREQYEVNPYPRWVRLAMPLGTVSLDWLCQEFELKQLQCRGVSRPAATEILVAGCGTGQHAIGVASRFTNCKVTAVDLSVASLAYAQRKTRELLVENIEYLQADVLDLHKLKRQFDIIQSSGVLHHMQDPMEGWRALTNLLRPGGWMKIGLYSEHARRPITRLRSEVASLDMPASKAEIKKFRQLVIESEREEHRRITEFTDFYSSSEITDLIFHVQEQNFTLPQIENYLNELGLEFSGFESKEIVAEFRRYFGDGADIYDLSLWDRFERHNPNTFTSMYQFWCQRSA